MRLALDLGVSHVTVSTVLTGRVTSHRVLAAAEKLAREFLQAEAAA